ncbi:MAG TPA: ribosomal RNA small subunit methyltransferase I [Rubrivivax sp.]|nr:ribosomal RNA small subunit methyltransferase I [Rubrivivax sp.]HPO18709.1 ribosomal RNA small subunit methyltransferase I [Rubrivivax sp.]
MSRGRLLLVPNTLDLGAEPVDIRQQLPLGVLQLAAGLSHWLAEDARSARAFLKRVHAVQPLALPLQAIDVHELPRPPKGRSTAAPPPWPQLLAPALAGHDLGLISEAGLPAVADPGAAAVAAAHALGIAVLPLPGASSLLLALAASGLNGQCFAFAGYLPQQPPQRAARLRELQAQSRRHDQTQLLIETPYRNGALLQALLDTLDAHTRLSVSCGLGLPTGWTRSERIAAWRQRPQAMPERVPAVFAFLAAG